MGRVPKSYEGFHFALFSNKEQINERTLIQVINKIGLAIEKLKKDIERPEVSGAIQLNMELAQKLGINGTPAIIGGKRKISWYKFEKSTFGINFCR